MGAWMMSAEKQSTAGLDVIYRPIAGEMREVETRLAGSLKPAGAFVGELLAHAMRGAGKRLRPALLFLAGRAAGKITGAHIRFALSVEAIHAATLVHDDVLDEASLRRNRPTMNVLWGNEPSVLFGDYLFTQAFKIAASAGEKRALEIIADAAGQVCEGELLQIAERGNLGLSEERYLEIVAKKTAVLCESACRLGAILAGAKPGTERRLAEYGRGIGVAFQIVDDCLDLTGDERETGKSLGTDLRKGKYTLPVIHLLRTDRGAKELARKTARDLSRLGELRQALRKAGSIDYALAVARDSVARAKASIEDIGPPDIQDSLKQLADYIVTRRK
jgi:octaprenyl-diphosphate synthase